MSVQTVLTANTIIDLSKMQSSNNNYDSKLVHPFQHTVTIIGRDGRKIETTIGHIAMLAAIANEFKNPGNAIDHMFSGIDKEKVSDICKNF